MSPILTSLCSLVPRDRKFRSPTARDDTAPFLRRALARRETRETTPTKIPTLTRDGPHREYSSNSALPSSLRRPSHHPPGVASTSRAASTPPAQSRRSGSSSTRPTSSTTPNPRPIPRSSNARSLDPRSWVPFLRSSTRPPRARSHRRARPPRAARLAPRRRAAARAAPRASPARHRRRPRNHRARAQDDARARHRRAPVPFVPPFASTRRSR
mmetsp:Transcript_4203/g.16168  ORF Transcript_4203/g.16168 Transcript_4203/m.16168 type:complete len:213 (+) Transcript_4203:358-996(+)